MITWTDQEEATMDAERQHIRRSLADSGIPLRKPYDWTADQTAKNRRTAFEEFAELAVWLALCVIAVSLLVALSGLEAVR